MPRGIRLRGLLCLLAAAAVACACATPSEAARHRSKHSAAGKHHASATRHKSRRHKESDKDKPELASLESSPAAHTPTDKADCIAASQTFYRRAQALGGRGKGGVPKEFERVVSNLDQFCGEEEFDKARVSIDWMDTCLKSFKEPEPGSCVRGKSYFCALDPASETCRSAVGEASDERSEGKAR